MGVFYFLLLTPILAQHFKIGRGYIDFEKRNKRALLFFFTVLTVLLMLRHKTVGTDTKNYIYYFNSFAKMGWDAIARQSGEVGFIYFAKIISLLSKEPQFFIAAAAIAIVCMIYPTYNRLCHDASFTIILFCTMSTFVMMFSGIRQMLAIGLGFVAYEFTRRKKLVFFILTVVLALTFHTSAFMLIFMYPVYYAKITKNWLYAVVPILLLIFVFNSQIFSVLGMILEHYTGYDATIQRTGAYTMLILFAFFAVISFLFPEESRLDRETVGLRNFLLLSVAIQMFAPLHMIAMRMNYYYIIFIPLLLPKIIEHRSEKWSQVALVTRCVLVACFFAFFFLNAQSGSNLNVFPYRFFWEN